MPAFGDPGATLDRMAMALAAGLGQIRAMAKSLHRVRIPVAEADRALFWRGALTVATNPSEILWHGLPIALSPLEIMLLGLLIRRGRASHDEIEREFAGAGACTASLDVIAHRVRRKFASLGAPDPIERRRGWGMILRVEPDMHGSTGLWIGGAEWPPAPALRARG